MTDVLETAPPMSSHRTASLAAHFALLADPLRLRIIQALAAEQLCTTHLIAITRANQTTVSHHLRILREAGVVIGEAAGRFTWYRLAPDAFTPAEEQVRILAASGQTLRLRATDAG